MTPPVLQLVMCKSTSVRPKVSLRDAFNGLHGKSAVSAVSEIDVSRQLKVGPQADRVNDARPRMAINKERMTPLSQQHRQTFQPELLSG